MSRIATIGAALGVLCATTACATDKTLDDIALVSVRAVAPSSSDKPRFQSIAWAGEPLIAIEFSTRQDLIAFLEERDSMVRGKVFFCEDESALRVESDPHVYDRQGVVARERSTSQASIAKTDGRFTYIVAVRPKVETPAAPGAIAYDLRRDQRDLCLILRGGNVLGRTIASNVLTIPSATVRDALAK